MSSAVPAKPLWKLIDWRVVAACGLPVWAFLFGMLLSPRPAWLAHAAAPGQLSVIEPEGGVAIAPMPREIVIRQTDPEVVSVPLVVPVPVEPIGFVAAAVENKLPASELLPGDRCKTYETKLRFHPTLADAADEARKSRKMLFVLHISGDFEDPGFTWNNAQALREGALSDGAVGEFIGDHFEATHQKVGTFVVAANGQKQGGNVASYFCLSDGTVLHAVAGPLDAGQFLREAKWAAEVRKLAVTEAGGEVSKYRGTIRKAHAERLAIEHGVPVSMNPLPQLAPGAPPVPNRNALRSQTARRVGTQGQVHLLLAQAPLPKLSQLYPIIFEGILKERLSALPVQTR